jgi:L-galactose dehydrogenase
MEYRKLGKTDLHVSKLSFGASPLGNVFEEIDEPEAATAVNLAIDHGINFFDVAPFYGDTLAETRLGKALKGKRNTILLATKCCRYGENIFDFSFKRVINSIDESLKRLKTDYVDLFQVHDIEFGSTEQVLNEALPAALKVKESGKARYIGFTGLPVRYLAKVARQIDIDTILSWGHYNLLEDEINNELVPLSKEKGFGLMNAAPFLQRILTESPLPHWHRSPEPVKEVKKKLIDLCNSYGVRLSDIAIKYATDHPNIATTITGMATTKDLKKNLTALNLEIPGKLLSEIKVLTMPIKNMMWFEGRPENNV